MPIYLYQDQLTDYRIELFRPFGANETMPQDNELPKEEQGKERNWRRLISNNIKTTKAANWGAGKGNW